MEEIWNAIRDEFADLPTQKEIVQVALRLLTAGILGAVLGFEREVSGKPAGLRTYILVSMGCAFFVMVPQIGNMSEESISRIIQGLATGIGFIGTGAIIKHATENRVEGLTTAAGVWFIAAVGIAVGLGREASAVLGTVMALLILWLVPNVGPKSKEVR